MIQYLKNIILSIKYRQKLTIKKKQMPKYFHDNIQSMKKIFNKKKRELKNSQKVFQFYFLLLVFTPNSDNTISNAMIGLPVSYFSKPDFACCFAAGFLYGLTGFSGVFNFMLC